MTPAMILAAIDAVVKAIALIQVATAEAKRQGEWTPEQEAEVDARMAAAFLQDHWRPTVTIVPTKPPSSSSSSTTNK